MKLAEAIRLGEFELGAAYGCWLADGCGCAVGRAAAVVDATMRKIAQEPELNQYYVAVLLSAVFDREWPWTKAYIYDKFTSTLTLNHIMVEMSDRYEGGHEFKRHSMSEIAAWVETIEPKDEQYDAQREDLAARMAAA